MYSSTRSRVAPKKKANKAIPTINPALIYAERELWSPQFALWARYAVSKPRLPTEEDNNTRWVDLPVNSPRSFGGFIGEHLKEFFDAIELWNVHFEENHTLPDVMTISGPGGSGKSAAARIFVQRLVDYLALKDNQSNKWRLIIDAKTYTTDFSILWSRISKFIDPPLEKFLVPKYRLVVMDNFDAIPASHQQILKNIMSTNMGKVKFLFICENPRECMTGFFLSKASIVKTRSISERDALSVVLSILHRNRIGYEREGIQVAFQRNNNAMINLSAILDAVQKVFVSEHYVSRENVVKVMRIALPPPVISASAAMEPLERCQICTLRPPCQHISQDDLNTQGLARRKALPRYKAGSMACPEFVRYGHCSIFNKYGQCSLDHPKNIHTIDAELKRCPQCTIPWPCEHCAYSSERTRLWHLIEDIHARMGRLRQINIPDPPLYYTRHLEHIPNWRQRVAYIDTNFVTQRSLDALKAIEEWFQSAYSINTLAYTNRCKLLLDTFGDLCTSELIDPKGPTASAPVPVPPKPLSVNVSIAPSAPTDHVLPRPSSPSNHSIATSNSSTSRR